MFIFLGSRVQIIEQYVKTPHRFRRRHHVEYTVATLIYNQPTSMFNISK